jgi:hypothetical protein
LILCFVFKQFYIFIRNNFPTYYLVIQDFCIPYSFSFKIYNTRYFSPAKNMLDLLFFHWIFSNFRKAKIIENVTRCFSLTRSTLHINKIIICNTLSLQNTLIVAYWTLLLIISNHCQYCWTFCWIVRRKVKSVLTKAYVWLLKLESMILYSYNLHFPWKRVWVLSLN